MENEQVYLLTQKGCNGAKRKVYEDFAQSLAEYKNIARELKKSGYEAVEQCMHDPDTYVKVGKFTLASDTVRLRLENVDFIKKK